MNTRLRHLRKLLELSQEDFGKRLGVTGASISRLEKGERSITEQMVLSICREYNVREEWLRDGLGDEDSPFVRQESKIAEMVSRLLEEDNPFYDLILDSMKAFDQLDTKEKQAVCNFSEYLAETMAKRKKEDD